MVPRFCNTVQRRVIGSLESTRRLLGGGMPASKLADALKQIHELHRMLGKQTMEAEILKEAVEIARS